MDDQFLNPAKLKKLKKKCIDVTEHAFLRFFERVLGYNLDEVSKWIVPDSLMDRINQYGDGVYSTDKYKIVVKNGKILTILSANHSPTFSKIAKKQVESRSNVVRKATKALHFDQTTDEALEDYYVKRFRL